MLAPDANRTATSPDVVRHSYRPWGLTSRSRTTSPDTLWAFKSVTEPAATVSRPDIDLLESRPDTASTSMSPDTDSSSTAPLRNVAVMVPDTVRTAMSPANPATTAGA